MAFWRIGEIHRDTEMTEEQQDEPDSPSTQLDLTPHVHDDSPYDINEVVKKLTRQWQWRSGYMVSRR